MVQRLAEGDRSILSFVSRSSFPATQYPRTSVSYVGMIVTSKKNVVLRWHNLVAYLPKSLSSHVCFASKRAS